MRNRVSYLFLCHALISISLCEMEISAHQVCIVNIWYIGRRIFAILYNCAMMNTVCHYSCTIRSEIKDKG